METANEINYNSFGDINNQADSLLIELTNSVISFCEFDVKLNCPLRINHYPIDSSIPNNNIDHIINSSKHFQAAKQKYSNVFINYFTPNFTLCPTLFFNVEESRKMLEFNVGSINNDLICIDSINPDIKLIYSMDENLKSIFNQLYPNHQINHIITVLSKLSITADEHQIENVTIGLFDKTLFVILKNNQKIIFANQFSTTSQEDILYYILFLFEQYQLNPLITPITIVGNYSVNSSICTSLKKYFKNVKFALGHKKIDWKNLNGMPQHFNYSLINRVFCE